MRLSFLLIFVGAALLTGCGRESGANVKSPPEFHVPPLGTQPKIVVGTPTPAQPTVRKIPPSDPKKEVTTPSGLKYEDFTVGTGQPAKSGDNVTVHYTGWLTDGTLVDTSLDRQVPYTLQLGHSPVIRGWHEGIEGMKVGGRRKLTIPSALGYGEEGRQPRVPPHAVLIFEIELVKLN